MLYWKLSLDGGITGGGVGTVFIKGYSGQLFALTAWLPGPLNKLFLLTDWQDDIEPS